MNRIELYVDGDNRLSLDFYYKSNDDYPMSKFKGKECYSVISKLCESPILNIEDREKLQESTLIFNECILNISEVEYVFSKRGTGPIKLGISKYYESKKKETFKPKKVKRQNKYIGKQIITGVLVLAVLGVVIGKEISDKKRPIEELPQETTIVYETEAPSNDIYQLIYTSEEGGYSNLLSDINFVVNPSDNNSSNDITFLGNSVDNNDSNEINVFIDFEDFSDTAKAKRTRERYGKLIEKYSKMYGLDPIIVTGIATQERGVHSETKDPGGATGLMQMQNSVWSGEKLTAYNHETKSRESIIVSEESLSDLEYNIKVGCMYFQNCMDYMDNNLLAAIQCYNYGYGNMQKVLNQYSYQTGKTKKEILSNVSDCGWLDCRYVVSTKIGDSGYVEHVLRWIGSDITVNNLKIGDKTVNLNITNQSEIKVK